MSTCTPAVNADTLPSRRVAAARRGRALSSPACPAASLADRPSPSHVTGGERGEEVEGDDERTCKPTNAEFIQSSSISFLGWMLGMVDSMGAF